MHATSILSILENPGAAIQDVVERLGKEPGPQPFDLAVVFVSPHHAETLGPLAQVLKETGLVTHILGVTGETIVGQDHEIEDAAAISLWAIRFPQGVTVTPVRLEATRQGLTGWPPESLAQHPTNQILILLADPFSFPTDEWLASLNTEKPALQVVGGNASGGHQPGNNRLALGSEIWETGAVGVLIEGPVRIRTVVSQGCRPIGHPLIVTRTEKNLVRELGRRPALEVFQEIFEDLEPSDQRRVLTGLHLGRVINEYQERFNRGDFLVRNVLGATEEGAIAITDHLRVGQTVQFHVRDADSADEDLRELLLSAQNSKPAAALLFSCNGRGTRLFNSADHDVSLLHEILGKIPVAGFFAMGEIGPIGGRNFLHGFTASIVLFESE